MSISDDVMKAARELVDKIWLSPAPISEGVPAIARALLAERERSQNREDSPLLPKAIPYNAQS